jgi:hypothetical protein
MTKKICQILEILQQIKQYFLSLVECFIVLSTKLKCGMYCIFKHPILRESVKRMLNLFYSAKHRGGGRQVEGQGRLDQDRRLPQVRRHDRALQDRVRRSRLSQDRPRGGAQEQGQQGGGVQEGKGEI